MSRYAHEPKVLGGGNWLKIKEVEYYLPVAPGAKEIEEKEKRPTAKWEACVRSHAKKPAEHGCDAAELCVLFKLHGSAKATHIGFVSQYRAPLDAHCIEFCAGLIDEGETPEQGALRELMEETGIADGNCGAKVKVLRVSPPIAYEPGLTSSCCAFAEILIELPEGKSPQQYNEEVKAHRKLEEAEQGLQMHVLSLENLSKDLFALKDSLGKNTIIDCKVWSWTAARTCAV